MKTRIRLIEVLLIVMNLAGVIWVSAYSRDNGMREIILEVTESTLQKKPQKDKTETAPAKVKENRWQAAVEQFEAMQRKIETGDKSDEYAMAVTMQTDVAKSYARDYKRYRTASYFAAVIFGGNVCFLIFAAAVLENLFARVPCKEPDAEKIDNSHESD